MANPLIHSKSSVKRWGGKVEDYLPIHELLDSTKATMHNQTARFLTHNTWFAYTIVPKIFGYNIINSDGRSVDSVDIAMLHIAEDFRMKFVPSPQDFLQHMQVQAWMCNGVKVLDSMEAQNIVKELNQKLHNENN